MRGHERRLAEIRARAHAGLTRILAVSEAVRAAFLGLGYDPELLDVVRQAMPHETAIWEEVGHDRAPGRHGERLRVAFLGSAYPHKGPQLLVEAAQLTQAQIEVRIIGEIPAQFAGQLRALDGRGVLTVHGAFAPHEIGELLREVDAVVLPSLWWDCAPLAAAECLAARTPIVVPRLGGLPETVRDGIDGLVFNGLDAADLARQLDRLALEPGLLEQLQAGIEAPRPFGAYIDELEEYYGGSHALRPQPERRAAVRWKGEHGQPLSLSIINDQITARLSGPLQRVNADGTALDPPLPHPAAVEVHQQWPPDLTPPGAGAMAAIIPWEFGSVPADWVTSVNRHIDELWVPSEFVRNMYVADGVEAERVVAIPNGVDLDAFHPVSEAELAARTGGTRFLFVGGLTWRKGPDLLLGAYIQAFSGRDDVTLVVKGFGSNTVYATGAREPIREYANSGQLPRVELSDESLTESELAELFRSCDVLVHPYRGEGFGMPVLEAMASGLPVIVTAGGPTDEFCPSEAGWRIRASRKQMDPAQLGQFSPSSTPWILEPELDHLIELLREADRDLAGRRARGRAARAAAEQLSWEAVTERYQQRIDALASRPPKLAHIPSQPFPLTEEVKLRVLATPAWRGRDRLAELLREWGQATTPQTSACLYLLADPAVAGEPAEIEAHVVQAAQRGGLNLESCADINVLMEAFRADRDQRLQLAVDAYVPLHAACAGQRRYAARAGTRVIEPGAGEVAALLSASDSASRPDGR